MHFIARARYIRFSPYKLRPIADVIRGKDLDFVFGWLTNHKVKKAQPIKKLIESAAANAKSLQSLESSNLLLKEIRVDQGPTYKYFRPGAMGRSQVRRKRFSHISVILDPKINTKKELKVRKKSIREEKRGTKSKS